MVSTADRKQIQIHRFICNSTTQPILLIWFAWAFKMLVQHYFGGSSHLMVTNCPKKSFHMCQFARRCSSQATGHGSARLLLHDKTPCTSKLTYANNVMRDDPSTMTEASASTRVGP
ncbi:TPA: hypothetical protein ACH3X1_001852 [Trebouxia sp. C0004]